MWWINHETTRALTPLPPWPVDHRVPHGSSVRRDRADYRHRSADPETGIGDTQLLHRLYVRAVDLIHAELLSKSGHQYRAGVGVDQHRPLSRLEKSFVAGY